MPNLMTKAWRALAAAVLAAAVSAANASAGAQRDYDLARSYAGLTGERLDPQKAFTHLRSAAEQGHVAAQVDLAFLFFNGNQQVGRSLPDAFDWFRRAARAGSVPAQCMLGDFYKDGLGGAPREPRTAFGWYARTATAKDRCAAKSQFELYGAYEAGRGVARDMPRAVAWLRKSADAGNPRAQAALGRNYLQGHGVPRDEQAGRMWLRKSREGVAPHDDHDHGNEHANGRRQGHGTHRH
jgi:TPR repeat protein